MIKLPELLCPAGSAEALDAAIEGGADAVYFGGSAFNARMNAKNFGGDALRSAVLRAHTFGVKVYLTLNTLVSDREIPALLDAAGEALRAGADALIVADLGAAMAIKRRYPSAELHASTQMSAHHSQMGTLLQQLGFTRMVIARETSFENLKTIVHNAPIEIEYFIHGALCVSHSGQCLFSSLVGNRSGNRGECAQPCRLPYACANCSARKRPAQDLYPLSLKDLSLAAHVPKLIESGVTSLKIEGRMKSPEYVLHTARIWRTLLDEHRSATAKELQTLADIFSRSGFTDGYFTGQIGKNMLGIRRTLDKQASQSCPPFSGLTKRVPLSLQATFRKEVPAQMTLSANGISVTVSGEIPQTAKTAPLEEDTVRRCLSKFGGTPYTVVDWDLTLEPDLMLPISKLNELRRTALQALENAGKDRAPDAVTGLSQDPARHAKNERATIRSACFQTSEQITPQARRWFQRIYLPLHRHTAGIEGVLLPPVLFDDETASAEQLLLRARQNGARYASVSNLGQLSMVRHADLIPVGDFRLNVTNTETIVQLEDLGIGECTLSPELTLPQMRDIGGNSAAIVYGRIPLMLLEKCVIRDLASCRDCQTGSVRLQDRKGICFPILREWEHRNVIYNSVPTCMSDKQPLLKAYRLSSWMFLFSTETASQVDKVIAAYKECTALSGPVRRIRE